MPQTKEQKRIKALAARLWEIRALERTVKTFGVSPARTAKLAAKLREAENIKAKLTDEGRRQVWALTGEQV